MLSVRMDGWTGSGPVAPAAGLRRAPEKWLRG